MSDDHHLTSYEPYQARQDLGIMADNLEIALARLALMPTKADLRGVLAAIFGSAALVILLEVFWRNFL
jgi:hypothetical protein